jgi:cytochrome P450
MTTDSIGVRAPGSSGRFLLGHAPELRADPIGFLLKLFREHGDVVRFGFGPKIAHLVVHPEAVKQVLIDRQRNYIKGRLYADLKLAAGEGLVTSEGDHWRRHRRILQPAFHSRRIEPLATVVTDATRALLDRWEGTATTGPIDISDEMTRLVLRIAGLTLFSVDLSDEAEEVGRVLPIVVHHVLDRPKRLFNIPERIPTPRNRRFTQALARLDRLILDMIARRRRQDHHGDMLTLLMDARDEESGEKLSDTELRDEAVTSFVAGHETAAASLSWLFYLLSRHPAAARRIREEALEVLGSDGVPTVLDLPRMPYTKCVIQETMRLFPPPWIIPREAVAADTLMGYAIPAGSFVVLSPFITHRHPAFWDNPEGFDPDRFSPERSHGWTTHAYLPFGTGPRKCIGANLAMMWMQLVVPMVVRQVRLDLIPGYRVEFEPSVALRPKAGCRMSIVPIARDASVTPRVQPA